MMTMRIPIERAALSLYEWPLELSSVLASGVSCQSSLITHGKGASTALTRMNMINCVQAHIGVSCDQLFLLSI